MTAVKVCGITSERDLQAAAGADLLGFVVATGTRRSLETAAARELMAQASGPKVAVTTATDPPFLITLAGRLRLQALQLNGPISQEELRQVRRSVDCEVWLAVHIGTSIPDKDVRMWDLADCIVLDTAAPQGGGTGRVHDWNVSARLRRELGSKRVALAGGLNPDNVGRAIETVGPDIVDVSSGVETNGTKDAVKIDQFVQVVKRCR